MTPHKLHLAILRVLFQWSPTGRIISLRRLAGAVELSIRDTGRLLVELDRAGLADAARLRLTMAGLVLAASSSAGSARGSAPLKIREPLRPLASGSRYVPERPRDSEEGPVLVAPCSRAGHAVDRERKPEDRPAASSVA